MGIFVERQTLELKMLPVGLKVGVKPVSIRFRSTVPTWYQHLDGSKRVIAHYADNDGLIGNSQVKCTIDAGYLYITLSTDILAQSDDKDFSVVNYMDITKVIATLSRKRFSNRVTVETVFLSKGDKHDRYSF